MQLRLFSIPNLITLLNLLCGSAAVVSALMYGNRYIALWLIIAGACFDFFDGLVARLLRQTSPIGVQLDSLADVVTFGLAPAAILFRVYVHVEAVWLPEYAGYGVFLLTAFSALRLARFNVDPDQATEFRGLPTPAAGILCASVGLLFAHLMTAEAVLGVALAVSYLLICPIRMFSLKFHGFGWRGNEVRYLFLATCVALPAIHWLYAIPAIIVLYILISTAVWICRC